MQRYILERAVQGLVTLFILLTIVFFVSRLAGDPLDVMMGEYGTPEDRAALAAQYGLDKPLHEQYGIYLTKVVRGDFGKSLRTGRPTLELLMERLPATLELGLVAILFSTLIGVPIGVYSATRRGTMLDTLMRMVAVLGQSMPAFWLGLALILVFGVWLRVLPTSGQGDFRNVILPAITMGWVTAAGLMRITRSSMLEVLDSEYVKLARAKGLSETTVVWKHALKNAALPVLTFWSILFVILLTGAVVTETVFAWPGVGRLAVTAVTWKDYPLVQTIIVFLGSMYITVNLVVDILYAYLNPRIART